ncbi:MAG: sugar ABC transporter substrate-binding protein [Candidatus Bipolaricaulota bacterium]|nr:sugar ABC transporter substrate-binding protein [Candidatus Bipolaricaulota bacterium]MDW8127170.1 sugar ABC transporter substrate-binding protein [Candidatus Bipolaricaulota bacterium]
MRKRLAVLLVLSSVLIGAISVAEEYVFYYISHGVVGDPWWAPVIKGAQDAAKLLGVTVHYVGLERWDLMLLKSNLEAAILAKPDGIILTITSYKVLDEPARMAIARGIPIIAVNVPDPRPIGERIPYLAYVGQDEFMAGKAMAERVVREFIPKAAVVMITEPGHVGLEARTAGIKSVLEPLGVKVDALDVTVDPALHEPILESYLIGHPEVDMVFALGPSDAWAAISLVKRWGKVGQIKLATIDVDARIAQAIKEGVMICAIAQQPYMQGFIPVVWLYLHKKVGFVPPDVPTGPAVIDKTNVDTIMWQIETTGGA